MRMKPVLAVLLGAALLPISACSGYDVPEEAPAPAQSGASNPFEEAQDEEPYGHAQPRGRQSAPVRQR